MARHSPVLDRLLSVSRHVRGAAGPLRSLAPDRVEATSLPELGERVLSEDVAEDAASAFAAALCAIVEAQLENFPENVFWDFDYAAARLMAEARAANEAASVAQRLSAAGARIVALEETFGTKSKIQFRYVHDFMYGFDWARWVQAAPARASVGPFDEPFVSYMSRRGQEIMELIDRHDAKYPELPRGVGRNPFGFSREPADEERLHKDLAERGLVPVEAWRMDAIPTWDRPFSKLREERARALGLWRRG